MPLKGLKPFFLPFILFSSKKRRERVEEGWEHYSPPTFNLHNFHTGAPIAVPFMDTRSSFLPLRFYLNKE
ncbi:hypothetical protein PIB30_080693, partial [Stylosanthes scabra]|nr:hypothetical protein [Stylosanthes scabra]